MQQPDCLPVRNLHSLTAVEESGLRDPCSLADGHAYHDLDEQQRSIVQRLPELWLEAGDRKYHSLERDFHTAFYTAAGQHSRLGDRNFRICPSASQSIDIAARWLHSRALTTALIEPTFDNLAQILRRWQVPLVSVEETAFRRDPIGTLEAAEFDALFLVVPNNPTGFSPGGQVLSEVFAWCRANHKILILDFCFRFFHVDDADLFEKLQDLDCTYLAIEDTGKTWPSLDMKASILSFSDNLGRDIADIYSEVFLCVSPFALRVLQGFVTSSAGGHDSVRELVKERRRQLREALAGKCVIASPHAEGSSLPVEWMIIRTPEIDDLALTGHLKRHGLACLPGRYFYWNSSGARGCDHVRFALLKPRGVFDRALDVLAKVVPDFG